ncbi:MAG TPA: CHAT domain-containing protein, partial [Blastocatellia bacterium]|nr:CHAT domain-containing protein [Blastocatellia bacterium]
MPSGQSESTVSLSIQSAGSPEKPSFLFNISLDGSPVRTNLALSPADRHAVRELSQQFNDLFERRGGPSVTAAGLNFIGNRLFELWLLPAWDEIKSRLPHAAQVTTLLIATDIADVLNIPWELLKPAGRDFVGFDARFSVRRLPRFETRLPAFAGQLPPGPLRVLFMACAPLDQAPLDFEREEEYLLRAVAGPNVHLYTGDQGSFEELRHLINEFEPHIVHLSGHGTVEEGLGYFIFEDERGQSDPRSSTEIQQELFAASKVQCVFISGCETGKAPPTSALGGICQGLVSEDVPMAVGWAASIADDVAIQFARTFYDTLASRQTVDRALVQARQSVRKMCEERNDPSWTLPVLYAATVQSHAFDPDPARPRVTPARPGEVQRPLPGMEGGYAESFVGRRREIQWLLPRLRSGELQVLLITGMGGAGKSTLATRLANKLTGEGFIPLAISTPQGSPLGPATLLQSFGQAFLDAGLKGDHAMLNDASIAAADRLRYITGVLNRGRFLLVLDNFEVNLDEASRRILDQEISAFYVRLLTHLSGGSRAIITSRYTPADAKLSAATGYEQALGDFPASSFLKFMMRDTVVEQRYYTGELPHALLIRLHELLGGAPRFLQQIRTVLRDMPAEDLKRALDLVALPAMDNAGDGGALAAARDRYCEEVFTSRLYHHLPEDSRKALTRAAVYAVPVSPEGLAAAAGATVEHVRQFAGGWRDYGLAYPDRERGPSELWSVYGLLRGWLLAPERITDEERKLAHHAAGNWLRDLESAHQQSELGLSWVDCLLETRSQFLAAGDCEAAREVTGRLSSHMILQGLYAEVIKLNEGLLACEQHPDPMSWIARAYYGLADYPGAREWYERCLEAAGDEVPQEAAEAWHGLASVDLKEGKYAEARDKLSRSLKMRQQIGNRAGEAATWHE